MLFLYGFALPVDLLENGFHEDILTFPEFFHSLEFSLLGVLFGGYLEGGS